MYMCVRLVIYVGVSFLAYDRSHSGLKGRRAVNVCRRSEELVSDY